MCADCEHQTTRSSARALPTWRAKWSVGKIPSPRPCRFGLPTGNLAPNRTALPEGSTQMGAKPFKKQTTAWKLGGKKVPPRTPGAEKVTTESGKWYGTVNGKHVPLCRDRQAAQRM